MTNQSPKIPACNDHFLTILHELTNRALRTSDPQELFQLLVVQFNDLFQSDGCYITLWDEETHETIPLLSSALPTDQYVATPKIPGEITMTESVLKAGIPLVAEDVFNTPYMSNHIARQFPTKSILGLPLLAEGNKMGALMVGFNTPHHFTEEEIHLGAMAADQISLVLVKIRLLDALKEREQQLAKLNAEKDQLFSVIGHDLRSPIATLSSFLHLLSDDFHSLTSEEIYNYLGLLRNSTSNTLRLLENLLDWSRLQREMFQFKPVPVNLHHELEKTIGLLTLGAQSKDISIFNKIPENLMIHADEYMLSSIFRNVISNSLKFTQENGKITITTRSLPGDQLEIAITDTGIGMDENTKSNLFKIRERLSIGKEGETSSGFGLILCKEFLEKQNGDITVESELGKGTTFLITLPVIR